MLHQEFDAKTSLQLTLQNLQKKRRKMENGRYGALTSYLTRRSAPPSPFHFVIPALASTSSLHELTSSFALLHSANWVHKGFRSNNVLFFKQWNMTSERIPLSEMHVVGFEYTRVALAGETSIETQPSSTDTEVALYQHPSVDQGYRKIFDIYSLGVVLFIIALWRPLKTKFPRNKPVTGMNAAERKSFLLKSVDILGGEVGAAYRDVVRVCLSGDFGDDSLENEALLPRAFLLKVVNVLESCRA